MSVFITGSTGYLGSSIVNVFLRETNDSLILLVRAYSIRQAEEKLWKAFQINMDYSSFEKYLNERIKIVLGDISEKDMELEKNIREKLYPQIESIIHCATILSKKNQKKFINLNIKGTLELIKFAQKIQNNNTLKKFSFISTVSVAGIRKNEFLHENNMVDWDRKDLDPYYMTKKICEKLVMDSLCSSPLNIFRPSAVIGNSTKPETTQFNMLKALMLLGKFPILPLNKKWKMDIVPVDYLSKAIVKIHKSEKTPYTKYNISSGTDSPTYKEMVKLLKPSFLPGPIFLPFLYFPFKIFVSFLTKAPKIFGIRKIATLLKVSLPYIRYNTTFDNTRVVNEMGKTPKSFLDYAKPLIKFARENKFKYPYKTS